MPKSGQADRASPPAQATVCTDRNTSSTSESGRLYRATCLVDQRLNQREQTTRPSGHGVVPPAPRTGTARTADSARCTNRLSTRSKNANASPSHVSPTDSSASVETRAPCNTNRRSCGREQPIGHHAQAIVRLGRGHRSPRTRHRARWCNAPFAKIQRPFRRAKAKRRARRGLRPRRRMMLRRRSTM